MGRGRITVWSTGLLLLACCVVAALAGLRLAVGPWHVVRHLLAHDAAGHGRPTFDDLVTAACTGALVAAVLWLATSTTLVTLAHLARNVGPVPTLLSTVADRVELAGPLVVRRLVGALFGLAVATGTGGTAYADPGLPDPSAHRMGVEIQHGLDGLALPDRVTDDDAPERAAPARAPRPHPVTVVVAPGDSLWSISDRLLGAGSSEVPTDADITAAWHRLHRANRGRLSTDPDLIRPGTVLHVPDLHPTAPPRKEPPR